MKYRVIFTPEFEADIEAKIAWLREQHAGEHVIQNWFNGLYKAMWATETMPRLYMVDEWYTAEVGRKSHKVTYHDHLAVYQVDDDRKLIQFVAFHGGPTRK